VYNIQDLSSIIMITDSSEKGIFLIFQNVEARRNCNRMLKFGVPPGAVKQAMMLESHQANPQISPASNESYTKMLKYGLPIGAVCHAMKRHGYKHDTTDNMKWWHGMYD
jgi:hypothetical protein